MRYNINAQLTYEATGPGTIFFNIRALSYITESLQISPGHLQFREHTADHQRMVVVQINEPGIVSINYTAEATNAPDRIDLSAAEPMDLSLLPPSLLCFLNPSRYCQSDKLTRFAERLFGSINNEFAKVTAIAEWIYTNVEYISGSTNGETTACDTITQQAGVCRDFAHLGIALCRALNIPARYCSVYAWDLYPKDFHACFEALIAGHWILFDATRLAPLNGFVKIATGLDAADTPVASLFGKVMPQAMTVNCELAGERPEPLYYIPGNTLGIRL